MSALSDVRDDVSDDMSDDMSDDDVRAGECE